MIEVRQTDVFAKWFKGLRDIRAKAQIIRRIDRATAGNLGEVRSIEDGVSEMKIDYGPGYRLYFTRRGLEGVILLCGGDKGSQDRDIREAKKLAKDL